MKMHTTTIELATRDELKPDQLDQLMENLATLHPAIATSPRGWLEVTVSLPAEHVGQAVALAIAAVEQAAGHPTIAVTAMPEDEADAREGWSTPSDVVTVTEAAEQLGVSRQAVLDRIRRHTLPAEKVGRDYAIPRAALGGSTSVGQFTALQNAAKKFAQLQPAMAPDQIAAMRKVAQTFAKMNPPVDPSTLAALKEIQRALAPAVEAASKKQS